MKKVLKQILRIPYAKIYLEDERITKVELKKLIKDIYFVDSVDMIKSNRKRIDIFKKLEL